MSVEHSVPSEVSRDLLDPFCDVDEKEAEDINSCLNFLSILDDEETTETCNFTLFRKKDDKEKDIIENNNKKCESTENELGGNNINGVSNNVVTNASPSSSEETSPNKTVINSDKSNINNEYSDSISFKSGSRSSVYVPLSKTDSSIFKTSNSIILKIPSLQQKYSFGQNELLQSDNINVPVSQNINCTEFKVLKKLKKKNISPPKFTKPYKLPNCSKKTILSAEEGDTLCKKKITLPSVSTTHVSVIPNLEPHIDRKKVLKTLQSSAEEKSEAISNELSSEVPCKFQLPHNLSDKDKKETENELILKNVDTTQNTINSLTSDSKKELTIIPECDNIPVIDIREDLFEIPQPALETILITPKNSAKILLPESKNAENIQENSVEVPEQIFGNERNVSKDSFPVTPFEKSIDSLNIIHKLPNSQLENMSDTSLKDSVKPLNSNTTKLITFFNSVSSVEISQISPQQKESEKFTKFQITPQQKSNKKSMNLKTRVIAGSKRKPKPKKEINLTKVKKKEKTTSNIRNWTNKSNSKEMFQPLKRMELPTFMNHNNSQEKEVIEIKDSEESNEDLLLSNIIRESNIEETEGPLLIDEASHSSSLNSDHTSDSLFILRDNYSDTNNKTGSSDMIDKIHNYCHSSKSIISEHIMNNFTSSENKLKINSLKDNVDQVSLETLYTSQVKENNILFDNETQNTLNGIDCPKIVGEIEYENIVNELEMKQIESSKTQEANEEHVDHVNLQNWEQNLERPDSEMSNKNEDKSSFSYSYNKLSPLSFTVQNVLENMFKYEPFPSSANMARVAKVLGTQWKDIRNWFVARRSLNKKHGLYLRSKTLTNCSYCPNAIDVREDKAIVHLLNKEHIQNMVFAFEKHESIFTHIQELCRENEETEKLEIEKVSEVNLDPLKGKKVMERTNENNSGEDAEEKNIKKCNINSNKCLEVNFDRVSEVKTNNVQIKGDVSALKNKTAPRLASNQSFMYENNSQKVDKPIENLNPIEANNLLIKNKENSVKRRTSNEVKKTGLRSTIDSNLVIGYRCPDCLKIFSTEWMLIKHSLLHKKFVCSECEEVFSKEEELKYHFKEHLIQTMDDDLYRYYVCFKCFSLDCICYLQKYEVPLLGNKQYIRPQKARRSEPFRSMPYSGVNDHLKVTWKEFWDKSEKKPNISFSEERAPKSLNREKVSKKHHLKTNSNNIFTAPTYTNITTFNCYLCESFFFTHDELEEHVAVHKIRANSKRRKKTLEIEENKKSKKLKVKYNEQDIKKYVCYYCNKSFKTHNLLVKHFKFFCKSLPLEFKSKPKYSLHLERVGNKFRLKTTESSIEKLKGTTKPPAMTKCKLCKMQFSSDKIIPHKRICTAQSNSKSTETQKNTKLLDDNYWEGTEKGLYLCKFCNIPLKSPKLIKIHIGGSCNEAPKEVVNEINNATFKFEDHINKYYKIIKRTDFNKIFPLQKIRRMLDISTFLPVRGHEKRIKCKFCEKDPLKYWLKLHLTKQCKCVPEELHYMINRYRSSIFNGSTNNENNSPVKPKIDLNKLPDKKVLSDKNLSVHLVQHAIKTPENRLKSSTVGTSHDSCQSTSESSNIFYDCHLCEEKFKISKDFISHMQNFHCMNINEKSCYKWLTKVDKNGTITDCEKISQDIDQQEEDSLITYNSISSEIIEESVMESDLDKEVIIASAADQTKNHDSCLTLPTTPDKSQNLDEELLNDDVSCFELTTTPNKGQNLDDELLNDDFEQFGNFIETVQLEDSAFTNASL